MRFFSLLIGALTVLLLTTTNSSAAPLPPEKERKLLELESQVQALEQKAFELKQKIRVISDKIFKKKFLTGKPTAQFFHSNKMAGYFHISQVTYTLIQGSTNRVLQTKSTTAPTKLPDTWRIFKGELASGRYILQVKAKVRGYNPVLTYINNYRLQLQNQVPFRCQKGKRTSITVVFGDKGGTNVARRLFITFRLTK